MMSFGQRRICGACEPTKRGHRELVRRAHDRTPRNDVNRGGGPSAEAHDVPDHLSGEGTLVKGAFASYDDIGFANSARQAHQIRNYLCAREESAVETRCESVCDSPGSSAPSLIGITTENPSKIAEAGVQNADFARARSLLRREPNGGSRIAKERRVYVNEDIDVPFEFQ